MANLAQSAFAQPVLPSIARRRLAPNIVCMFADDRPPVVNRPRRGRLPKAVAVFQAERKLRPGALCEFSTDGHPAIPVRIIENLGNGRSHVEAIVGHEFTFPDGQRGRDANVNYACLRRSVVLDLQFGKGDQK